MTNSMTMCEADHFDFSRLTGEVAALAAKVDGQLMKMGAAL